MNINGSKNLATVYKELMRARPDPSSLSEGAGLQTTNGPGTASFPKGPFQPHIEFPMTVQGDKARSFHANWYQRFPWLEYSPKLDAAFCFCC